MCAKISSTKRLSPITFCIDVRFIFSVTNVKQYCVVLLGLLLTQTRERIKLKFKVNCVQLYGGISFAEFTDFRKKQSVRKNLQRV